MNKNFLTGNLTADARLNTVSAERDAVSFTVATNEGYTDKDGQWVDKVEFHDCTRFVASGKGGKLVELLTKGRYVEVEGALKNTAPRVSATDGKTYHGCFIRVDELKFGPKPKREGEQAA